jgi:ferredoxin
MSDISKKLQEIVKELFGEKKIDVFIGYGKASVPCRASPIFLKSKDEADKLVWNEFCMSNLASYLPRFFVINPREKEHKFPRIGIAAKGCDGRAIVGLIKENQMPRGNLYIVGIACEGMNKSKNGKLEKCECCTECQYPAPLVYDELIGDKNLAKSKPAAYKRIEEFRKKPIQERWKYFLKEMEKCIRCYACRQVCPTCYCKECFTEETQPKWHGVSSDISEVIYYQLGRLFHQAGRCVDCGSCSWVCPVGIDLRLFLQGLLKDVKDLYEYEAGLSIEEPPPLAVFKMDDVQKFITEP